MPGWPHPDSAGNCGTAPFEPWNDKRPIVTPSSHPQSTMKPKATESITTPLSTVACPRQGFQALSGPASLAVVRFQNASPRLSLSWGTLSWGFCLCGRVVPLGMGTWKTTWSAHGMCSGGAEVGLQSSRRNRACQVYKEAHDAFPNLLLFSPALHLSPLFSSNSRGQTPRASFRYPFYIPRPHSYTPEDCILHSATATRRQNARWCYSLLACPVQPGGD